MIIFACLPHAVIASLLFKVNGIELGFLLTAFFLIGLSIWGDKLVLLFYKAKDNQPTSIVHEYVQNYCSRFGYPEPSIYFTNTQGIYITKSVLSNPSIIISRGVIDNLTDLELKTLVLFCLIESKKKENFVRKC